MARLAAQTKMGYYPTPDETLEYIRMKIKLSQDSVILDPCCGEGYAVFNTSFNYSNRYNKTVNEDVKAKAYGIELDTQRALTANENLDKVLCGSIYETVIRPLECFSMLYLNPPYEYEKGERMEYLFLKHSYKWLMKGGLLVYLVPEHILKIKKLSDWIARRYDEIQIYRFARGDYPKFKQVVLFGIKRQSEVEEGTFPQAPYSHIEDTISDGSNFVYSVSPGHEPQVFELQGIRQKEIDAYRDTAMKNIMETLYGIQKSDKRILSPLFPLRKGHLVSLLMSGVLNGKLNSNGIQLVFKCFTERQRTERQDYTNEKKITTDTYISGIRVIERGKWYDVI
jgi:16S rRNA G966 N2-methylase RsmD